jgi:hypothetical protein
MNPFGTLVFYGWFPFLIFLFTMYKPHQVVIVGYVGSYLFLPLTIAYLIPGIPGFDKVTITSFALLTGMLIFDPDRINSLKLSWIDIPMVIWCVVPFASNYTNDLGFPDAFKGMLHQTIIWGMPYIFGLLYINTFDRLKQLAIGIFVGGLLYMPFCLLEGRIGPLIHLRVYGFTVFNDWSQAIRYGGYRPLVFTPHGLAVSAWMVGSALIGVWFWQSGAVKKLGGIPISVLTPAILVTVVLLRSTGAWFILALGVVTASIARWLRTAVLIYLVIGIMFTYLYSAGNGTFKGEQVIAFVGSSTDKDRAGSLKFRFDNEEILSAKARLQPTFGWGWNGRNRVIDGYGKDITVTDSFWIIAFGVNGWVGLLSFWIMMVLPGAVFLKRYPARLWRSKKVAPAAILVVMITVYMLDCLSNAFPNQVYTVAAAGISGLLAQKVPEKA